MTACDKAVDSFIFRGERRVFDVSKAPKAMNPDLDTFGYVISVPGRPSSCRTIGVVVDTDRTALVLDPLRAASKRFRAPLQQIRDFAKVQRATVKAVTFKKSEVLKEYAAVLREAGATEEERAKVPQLAGLRGRRPRRSAPRR